MKVNANIRVGPKVRTLIALTMVLISLLAVVIPVYAAGSNFHKPSFLNRYEVFSGESNYSPDTEGYPFNGTATSIGFDSLYGDSKGFWTYLGEVPDSIADEDDWSSYRAYNGDSINGVERKWSKETPEEDDLKPSSEDLHIYAMTYSNSIIGQIFGSIGLFLVNALYALFSFIIDLMITLKSFNLADMVSVLDDGGALSNLLSTIFLIDPTNGNLSPLMLFGLLCFVGSLAIMAFKVLKGDLSIRKIATELGFFVLAICITAIFFTSSNAATVATVGTDFMTKLANNIIGSASDSTAVFIYNTGNASLDNSNTQMALINKTYIDQIIASQFGYTVNDLYIQNADGTSDFGDIEIVKEAIADALPDGNIDSFAVVTDVDGDYKINNLGYWFWAANSGVRIYAGDNGTSSQKNQSVPFYESGGKTLVRSASSDRTLFMVDFLNALKNHPDQTDAIKTKCDNILKNLCQPKYGSATMSILVVAIQNGLLAWASFAIIIFTVIGQLIITLGAFCMVIMPVLLLYGPTRSVASKMMYTYLLGFLRYLIGSALFNAMITVTTILSQQGMFGILISMVICFMMGKWGPVMIKEINLALTSLGRGKELRFMNRMYYGMDRQFDGWQKRKDARRRNRYVLGEDGRMQKDKSMGDKIGEGLRKDGFGFFGKAADKAMSRIPGTDQWNDRNEDIVNDWEKDQPFDPNANINNMAGDNENPVEADDEIRQEPQSDMRNKDGEDTVARDLSSSYGEGMNNHGLEGGLTLEDDEIYGLEQISNESANTQAGTSGLRNDFMQDQEFEGETAESTGRSIMDNAENQKFKPENQMDNDEIRHDAPDKDMIIEAGTDVHENKNGDIKPVPIIVPRNEGQSQNPDMDKTSLHQGENDDVEHVDNIDGEHVEQPVKNAEPQEMKSHDFKNDANVDGNNIPNGETSKNVVRRQDDVKELNSESKPDVKIEQSANTQNNEVGTLNIKNAAAKETAENVEAKPNSKQPAVDGNDGEPNVVKQTVHKTVADLKPDDGGKDQKIEDNIDQTPKVDKSHKTNTDRVKVDGGKSNQNVDVNVNLKGQPGGSIPIIIPRPNVASGRTAVSHADKAENVASSPQQKTANLKPSMDRQQKPVNEKTGVETQQKNGKVERMVEPEPRKDQAKNQPNMAKSNDAKPNETVAHTSQQTQSKNGTQIHQNPSKNLKDSSDKSSKQNVEQQNVNRDVNQKPISNNQSNQKSKDSTENVVVPRKKPDEVHVIEVIDHVPEQSKKDSRQKPKAERKNETKAKRQDDVIDIEQDAIDTSKLAKKDHDRKQMNLRIKNAGLRAVSAIPVVGSTINEAAAKTLHNKAVLKDQISDAIADVVSKTEGEISFNDAYDRAQDQILSTISKRDRKRLMKQMDKIKSKINRGDLEDIQKRTKTKRDEMHEKDVREALAAAEMRKQQEENAALRNSNVANARIKLRKRDDN